MPDFAGPGTPLTDQGMSTISGDLGVGKAELWAVMAVETSGCGYLPDRRPKILFERHIFHSLTNGRFDSRDPDVSQPTAGGYGASGAHQFDRLAVAISLDRAAALQSASWGLGQVLGENFQSAGFVDVETMVAQMVASEDAQFTAMGAFIKANGIDAPLRSHDWAGFARRYNGPDYAAHNYDGLLADHFHRFSTPGSMPDLEVRQVQALLTYQGFSPGGIDGLAGLHTANAIKAFQRSIGKPETGVIDDALIAALSELPAQ